MSTDAQKKALGDYLRDCRNAVGMTLADVEQTTDGTATALYICNLEEAKVALPAPHILHALAGAYVVPYVKLMELAGHVRKAPGPDAGQNFLQP